MSVVELARQILAQNCLFLDTETTGLGPTDEILEVAVVDKSGRQLMNTLVKPTIPIPSTATAIHGITATDTVGASSFADLLPLLKQVLGIRPVVIYNADYDLRMLEQSARAHSLTFSLHQNAYCAMQIYAEFYGEWNDFYGRYQWHRLEVAAMRCGIKLPQNLHRAVADAELTRQLLMFIAESKREG